MPRLSAGETRGGISMGSIYSLIFTAILALSFSIPVHAQELSQEEVDHLTIEDTRTAEVKDLGFGKMGNLDFVPESYPRFKPSYESEYEISPLGDGAGIGGIFDLINIGRLVWKIIDSNKAVANMETDMATALPKGTTWQEMIDWKTESKTYTTTYTNKLGAKVVDFTYRVLYTYGGKVMRENKALPGEFLTGMTIIPTNLKVLWGFKFNAVASVPTATLLNVGTPEVPIASARLFLRYSVRSLIKHHEVTKTYTIKGNGSFEDTSAE
jgi:hypothetical protein